MSENKETKEDSKEETEKSTETSKLEQVSLADGDVKDKGGRGDEPAAPKSDEQKIDVLLKATGNAPIMKRKKWAVGQDRRIAGVIDFIKNYLRLEPNENLFLYVNQAFAPSPDQTIKNLYECFGADGKLVLHYCKSQAWG